MPFAVAFVRDGTKVPHIMRWLLGLLLVSAATSISFLWLDRPLARFAHDQFQYLHRRGVDELSNFPNPLLLLALLIFAILGIRMAMGHRLSRVQANAFVCSASVISTEMIKNFFKFVFGRTWPETWVQGNPSFIRDGVYGFHFMHGGVGYQSFPSGHMATACAVLAVLWVRYPFYRSGYIAAGLLIGTGLVAGNFHFLSDVMAGAALGFLDGWVAIALWERFMAPDFAYASGK